MAKAQHIFTVCFALSVSMFSSPSFSGFGDLLKKNPFGDTKEGKALSLAKDALGTQSEQDEIDAGNAVAAIYLGASPMLTNERVQHYVNFVGKRVAAQSTRPELPWTFAVLDTESLNAFAAPGGKILITKGLYELLDTEDELAAVLGHEVAHVARQHHWSIIKKQKLVNGLSDIAASEVDAGSGLGQAAFEQLQGILKSMITSGIDRDGEYEADVDGVYLAARAGYDSSAMLSVLEKLQDAAKSDGDVHFLYQTHPTAEQRLNHVVDSFNKKLEAAARSSDYAKRLSQYPVE